MNVNAYEKQLRSKYMNVLGPPGNFRGDLKISNQNTWGGGGGPEQKIKFGWGS